MTQRILGGYKTGDTLKIDFTRGAESKQTMLIVGKLVGKASEPSPTAPAKPAVRTCAKATP